MNIKARKLTDVELLRKANSFTSGKDSHMSLLTAYKTKHSPCRTQLFWVELTDIPLFVASQFVRSHVGVQLFQLSKRTDRGGKNFATICGELADDITFSHNAEDSEEGFQNAVRELRFLWQHFDRYAPTDLAMLINAEAIMNMSAKRLCSKASKETREIWQYVLVEISKIDPDLVKFCKTPCVLSGVCRETKPCGYIHSADYIFERQKYCKLFD